jgi:MYXO-CTERM domain-containing protein
VGWAPPRINVALSLLIGIGLIAWRRRRRT